MGISYDDTCNYVSSNFSEGDLKSINDTIKSAYKRDDANSFVNNLDEIVNQLNKKHKNDNQKQFEKNKKVYDETNKSSRKSTTKQEHLDGKENTIENEESQDDIVDDNTIKFWNIRINEKQAPNS